MRRPRVTKKEREEPSASTPTDSRRAVPEGGGGGGTGSSAAVAPVEAQPGSPSKGWGRPIEPHPGWELHLERIKAMRSPGGCAYPAVVDSMGCERCADPSAPAPVQRFQTLVSLMLSSQTKDEVTYAACQRLKDGLGASGGFTAAGVAGATLETLGQLIYPVGFWRNKAKFLQAAGRDCVERCGGDIPESVEGLCALKGVGPKMAFICMAAAWGKNVGIGVDTHVHRIANRLGWVRTDAPQQTQAHLQAWLPRAEWDALNLLLVGFGQSTCTPIGPKCGTCSAQEVCPFYAGKAKSVEEAAAAAASARPSGGEGQ